jgi:hypothetical protein
MRAFIFKVMGLVLLIPVLASSQTFQGGIRGAVKDADGGVLPGTTVTLTNAQTGATRTSVTNERGEYVFASVAPGTYNLAVELSGFAPFRREGLEIGVATQLVQDVSMQVGGIAESVTVTGETPLIETATASVASAIDKAQLDVLPSPGRNVFIYSVTTPNVVHVGDPLFVRKQDQTNSSLLSLAGGPLRGNNYTLDGISINDMENRAVIIPNNDAIEEMKVQVNTYDAEMGRTGGGVFNALHRSGTNNWAGSGLWQNRPAWGRGTQFFEDTERGGSGEAFSSPYNLWSFAGGGPIVKDKTFFWATYEGYNNTESANASFLLPTQAQVNGDFSGTGRTIFDPLTYNPATGTRQPFPNNQIPANRIDPVGQAMAELLLGVGQGTVNATAPIKNVAREPTFKIDHQFNDKFSVSGTYLYYDSEEAAWPYYAGITGGEIQPFDTGSATLFRHVHTLAINATSVPSDDSVLTFRYGYNLFYDTNEVPSYDVAQLGFSPNFVQQVESIGIPRFPAVAVEGYGDEVNSSTAATLGSWSTSPIEWHSQEFSGVYSKFVGSHTLKAGAQYRKIGVDTLLVDYGASFYFDPGFTRGPDPLNPSASSGDALASLLLGLPNDSTNLVKATPTNVFINYYGGFVQDDWRVNSNLVLNLGVRLEHEDGLAEEQNRFTVGFDRDAAFPVQVPGLDLRGGLMYAGVDGNPTTQSDPKGLKVGPRAGFSYSLSDKTVLRGGYGLYWAPHNYPGPSQDTFASRGYIAVTPYLASSDGINPASQGSGSPGSLTDPYPNGVDEPVGNTQGLLTGAGGNIDFNDQFAPSPYVQQWSFDVQHELGPALAFKIAYLGSKGSDLWIGGTSDSRVNINQLDPSYLSLGSALNDPVPNPFFGHSEFGSLADTETIARGQLLRPYPQFRDIWQHHNGEGRSRYDALRFEFEKRFRGNWGARINYTYSRFHGNVLETGNTRVNDEKNRAYRTDDLEIDPLPQSFLDTPHWFNVNGMYRFPSPSEGIAKILGGGWSASVSAIMRTGFPLYYQQSSNNLGSGFGYDHQRPTLIGDPSVSGSIGDTYNNYLDPGALQNTAAYSFGNTGLTNTEARTPRYINWDVSFDKETELGGDARLTLRFEFINFGTLLGFNNDNFAGPRTIFGSTNFGKITSVGGFPGLLQFMAKVTF